MKSFSHHCLFALLLMVITVLLLEDASAEDVTTTTIIPSSSTKSSNGTSGDDDDKSETKWTKIAILVVVILLCLLVPVACTWALASPAEALKKLTIEAQQQLKLLLEKEPSKNSRSSPKPKKQPSGTSLLTPVKKQYAPGSVYQSIGS